MQIKSTRNKALDVECDISFSKHKNLSGQYCIVQEVKIKLKRLLYHSHPSFR